MRAYTVATVAVTLGISRKRLDNILSHFSVRGVKKSRQGVSRRLAPEAVVTLHLANGLVRSLGMPLGEAISLAEKTERAGDTTRAASVEIFSSAYLTIDLNAVTENITQRLADAVEVTPVPKRGRPPAK